MAQQDKDDRLWEQGRSGGDPSTGEPQRPVERLIPPSGRKTKWRTVEEVRSRSEQNPRQDLVARRNVE